MVLRAARQKPRRVATVGLPVSQYQLTAYVMSGMLCGLAGFLLANLNAFASPSTMAWTVSGELIVIVVLGGMGTVFGPLLGAFVLLGQIGRASCQGKSVSVRVDHGGRRSIKKKIKKKTRTE